MSDMEISANGLQFIATNEGFSGVVYDDVAGFQTVGYGHRVIPSDETTYGSLETVTTELALTILHNDVAVAVACINACVEVDINQNQFDSLTDFVYNVGTGAFQGSTLLKLLNESNFQGAANQFLRWDKAGNTVVQGLLNRREAEKALFLS